MNVEDAEPATVEPFVDCCVTTARLLVMFELLLASLVEYKRKIDKKIFGENIFKSLFTLLLKGLSNYYLQLLCCCYY